MIGRVYRGSEAGGLVRYLYGPGRHNEHENPHLVAAWDAATPGDLAALEPEGLGSAAVSYRALVAELEAPLAYAERVIKDPIWHCPLRTAPGDRALSDEEWGQVAVDLMDRTGIAARGDEGACRWIAVRHDSESIHVMAVLARQDGAPVRLKFDHLRVREACLAAEANYGLAATAPADVTAARHTTRAEVEIAARTGQAVPARDWLRTQVQLAATASASAEVFLDRLRGGGVLVSERHGADGQLTGYAVARPEDPAVTTAARPAVYFGGGKLAADLSLPRLQARWAMDGTSAGEAGDVSDAVVEDGQDRSALWTAATQASEHAVDVVRADSEHHWPDPERRHDLGVAGDAAAAAGEVLVAASRLIEGPGGGPLTRAAQAYDRAARETYRRTPAASSAGTALRRAAQAMARASAAGHKGPRRGEAAQVAVLVSQITRLSLSVAALRQAQGRLAQAHGARRAAGELRAATQAWTWRAEAVLAERHTTHAVGAANGASGQFREVRSATSPPRPSSGPSQGTGRGRR